MGNCEVCNQRGLRGNPLFLEQPHLESDRNGMKAGCKVSVNSVGRQLRYQPDFEEIPDAIFEENGGMGKGRVRAVCAFKREPALYLEAPMRNNRCRFSLVRTIRLQWADFLGVRNRGEEENQAENAVRPCGANQWSLLVCIAEPTAACGQGYNMKPEIPIWPANDFSEQMPN